MCNATAGSEQLGYGVYSGLITVAEPNAEKPSSYQVAADATKGITEIGLNYGRNPPAAGILMFGTAGMLMFIVTIIAFVGMPGAKPDQFQMAMMAEFALVVFILLAYTAFWWLDSKLALAAERVTVDAHNRTFITSMARRHEQSA